MAEKCLLVIVAVLACAVADEKWYFPDHEFDRTDFGDSIDRASMKFLKEAFVSATDKNVVASPMGVFTLLMLYAGGAGPQAQDELVRFLGGKNYTELSDDYHRLVSRLSSMESRFYTLKDKIYLSDQYTLNPEFANLVLRNQGDVETISFSDPQAALDAINRWGEEATRGYFLRPVPDDAISADTVLALFNFIFFQGQWNIPFDEKETKDKDFHVDRTTSVKKPTMHLLQPLFYYESEDLGAKLVELPYQLKGMRMVIIVPNEVDGLSSVIEKAERTGILRDVFKLEPTYADIDLYLPTFHIKSEIDLLDLLLKIGINKVLSEPATGIVREQAVGVSKAFQKAFVKVHEEGATAGAFTGVVIVGVSSISQPPPPIPLHVDRPFLFLILHEDKILFTGTCTR